MSFKKVKGNLITMAKEGHFDVIAHGCNCFCTQGAGIAKQMKEAFGTDGFDLEQPQYKGNYNKLGQIEWGHRQVKNRPTGLRVVNAYTQYEMGRNAKPVWLIASLMKINHEFAGMQIGLPYIGAGIGGLNPQLVEDCINMYMKDCDVTLVEYESNK